MDFKKILPVLALFILLSPFHAQAAIAVPWNATSTDIGYTSPTRVNGNDPIVQASSYAATNTAATSTLLNTSVNQFKIAALSGILKAVSGIVTTATAGTDYLTGNQTITLSGDVSGSGSTAITTTIGALKVLNSMIANGTIDLTTKVTGLLPVANGGTGSSTLSGILIGNGTSPVNTLTIGSNLSLVGTTLSATGGGGTGLSTTTPISGSNVLVYSAAGAGAAYGAATTSATCAGTVSCTSFNVLGPSPITITGSGGSGTYPFTPATNFGVGMSATTTGLWGQGGIYASSSTAYPTLAVKQAGAGFAATFDGGNVGIGTTSPAATLSIQGTGSATNAPLGFLFQGGTGGVGTGGGATILGGVGNTGGGGSITIAGGSSTGNGGGTVFIDGGVGTAGGQGPVLINSVNTNSKVGIGTTSPYATLSVNGNFVDTKYSYFGSSTPMVIPENIVSITGSQPDYTALALTNIDGGVSASADVIWQHNLSTATAYYSDCGQNSNTYTSGTYSGFNVPNQFYCYATDGPISFFAASSTGTSYVSLGAGGTANTNEQVRVTTTGVGIGSTTPHAKLSVNAGNTSPTKNLLELSYSTGATNSATTTLMTLASSTVTRVGIASTSPAYTLAVEGTMGVHGLTTSASLQSSIICGKEVTGGEFIAESVACVASAKRYKENIETLGLSLDTLMKLRPVSFTWKKDFNKGYENDPNKNGVQYSLIADEVQQVDPKLVSLTTGTTTFEGKTYAPGSINGLADVNHWVAAFVNWLQEIVKRQDASEQEIQLLKQQNAALEARIEALEARL